MPGRHGPVCGFPKGWTPPQPSGSQGSRQATITQWLTRAGQHAHSLHERCFHTLHLPHLQVDELCTRLRSATPILWLWLAIDPLTKIIPVLQLGPRTQQTAHALIHSLRSILAPGCIPLFTSDGLNLYFYALTAHFGQWRAVGGRGRQALRWQVAAGLIYGQVKQCYRRRKLVRVRHVMRLGTEDALTVVLQGLGFSGRLNTACIERVNLTIRDARGSARTTYLGHCPTGSSVAGSSGMGASLLPWMSRPHQALRVTLMQPRERGGKTVAQRDLQQTKAQAAGRTHRRWTAREVLSCPLPKVSA